MSAKITVKPLDSEFETDRDTGSVDRYDRFEVCCGNGPHTVTVRCSPDSGTPQSETCDCQGFKYRHDCRHIAAVYDAGVLETTWA